MKHKIGDTVLVKSVGLKAKIIGIKNNEYKLDPHYLQGCNCYREYEVKSIEKP